MLLSANPLVSSRYESGEPVNVRLVLIEARGQGRCPEIGERQEEPDRVSVLIDEVLQQEEIGVSSEASEQFEELGISRQHVGERAFLVLIVSPDAFQRQIEPIDNAGMKPARPVYRVHAIHPSRRKHDIGADRAAVSEGPVKFFARHLTDDCRQPLYGLVGMANPIAGQEKLTRARLVIQIGVASFVRENEVFSVRQSLAPERLVISPKGRAVAIRIPSGRGIGIDIERRIDRDIHDGMPPFTRGVGAPHGSCPLFHRQGAVLSSFS